MAKLLHLIKTFLVYWAIFSGSAFSQGSILLVGGGSENYNDWSDEPYRWLVQHAVNRRILILHYAEGSNFLPNYFISLGAVAATNLVINSRASANDSANYRAILLADGLFLRGGDQWRYVELWKGTLAEQAIKEVHRRGGVVGGTSAGAMVLSEVVFDARQTSVDPRAALRNPLSAGITFTNDFLGLAPGILADTHFYERGRIGRLLAMIAVYHAQQNRWIAGLGIDDRTALGMAAEGSAEVFGSGVFTLLRATERSHHVVQAGKPLGFSHVRITQLTKGFRVNLHNGELLFTPPTATAFTPQPVRASPARILLEGSEQSADWFAVNGSLAKFLAALPSNSDTVGIFSSLAAATAAQNVSTQLHQRGVPHHLLWLDGATSNDPGVANKARACAGFILVANHADSAAIFFDQATWVGNLFHRRLGEGAVALFLGNDAKLAGAAGVGNTEISPTAAYRGRLTLFSGIDLLRGMVFMPRAYENSDYVENRASGLFWSMAKSSASFGVLLDAGTFLDCNNGIAQVLGRTPAIIVEARDARWIDFSTYRASNSVGPRQSVALIEAIIHVLPESFSFDFSAGEVVSVKDKRAAAPREFRLAQNYPNPFNSGTTIAYELSRREQVSFEIFNLRGQKIATLVEGEQTSGRYAVHWQGAGLASGVYFYRLQVGNQFAMRKMALLR